MIDLYNGLDDIFTGVLGEAASLVAVDADAVEVKGIFTARYAPIDAGLYSDLDGNESALDIRQADLPECFGEGGHVYCRGLRFRAVSVQPDEQGMVKLILRKAGLAPV
ncbi:head-tail joining protein [Hyphococcus sp.]|uniref:head-tail joining protein n=1 Tax=Hyphococcus sp. TaxID=2038636 RepID=UPI00208622C8|nr:MAG: hypothetical protein DHS20C04_31330 [Marinicaulis sp.]